MKVTGSTYLWWTVAALGAMALAVTLVVPWPWRGDEALLAGQAPQVQEGGYEGSGTCRSCHPGAWASWQATYHRTMTQAATPAAVLAPFDGRHLSRGDAGETFAVMGGAQGEFAVCRVDAAEDGCAETWRVVMTTGSHRVQAYWLRNNEGILEQFPWVYLIKEGRWISNAESFLHPAPEEGLGAFYWSSNCVFCHTTGPTWPASNPELSETGVVELGIACEACHGPSEGHQRVHHHPLWRYQERLEEEAGDDSIVNPARLNAARSSAVCGRCHAVTAAPRPGQRDGMETFRPGERFEDHFDLNDVDRLIAQAEAAEGVRELTWAEKEAQGAFWPDMTVRVAGREYSGMVRSACATEGEMGCLSCHSMHKGAPEMLLTPGEDRSASCRGCHPEESGDFEAHTHHSVDSLGGDCLGCHMPHTSYGLLSATRSHRVGSPSWTGKTTRERPNACNLCHLDETLRWTAGWLARWYEIEAPEPLALGVEHETVAAGVLWMLKGDAVQRVIAGWHVGYQGALPESQRAADVEALVPMLLPLLNDPYAAVGHVARRALVKVPGFEGRDPMSATLAAEVSQAWQARSGRAELLQEGGVLNREALEALLDQRDDWPTWVSE